MLEALWVFSYPHWHANSYWHFYIFLRWQYCWDFLGEASLSYRRHYLAADAMVLWVLHTLHPSSEMFPKPFCVGYLMVNCSLHLNWKCLSVMVIICCCWCCKQKHQNQQQQNPRKKQNKTKTNYLHERWGLQFPCEPKNKHLEGN